jgi:hypothetical protein
MSEPKKVRSNVDRLRRQFLAGAGALSLYGAGVLTGKAFADSQNIYIEPKSFSGPYSYLIETDGTYVWAKDGKTGQVAYGGPNNAGGVSGTDASTVIQQAINALTPNRIWKEKVVLKGNFAISKRISLPSYLVWDARQASFKLANGANDYLLYGVGLNYVDILGGVYDGNKDNQSTTPCVVIYVGSVSGNESNRVKVSGVEVKNFYDHGVVLAGNHLKIKHSYIHLSRDFDIAGIYVTGDNIEVSGNTVSDMGGGTSGTYGTGICAEVRDWLNANSYHIKIKDNFCINNANYDIMVIKTNDSWIERNIMLSSTKNLLIDSYVNNIFVGRNAFYGYTKVTDNGGKNVRYYGNINYPTKNFKISSLSVNVGTNNTWGSASNIKSPSGVITYPRIKITWGGTFRTDETVTVRIVAAYSDDSYTYIDKSSTATGSLWLSDDDVLSLIAQGKDLVRFDVYAMSNSASTSVTVTVDAYGKA